jgi:hypothetical protein
VAKLKRINAELRAGIARLKGLKARPTLKPSGMDKATDLARPVPREKRRGHGKVRPRVCIEERVLPLAAPEGSRFKGYEPYLVQDLVMSVQAVRYRRERWQTLAGQTLTAPPPAGTHGHFRPNLHRFVLMQHHQGQSTLPRWRLRRGSRSTTPVRGIGRRTASARRSAMTASAPWRRTEVSGRS